MSSYSFSPLIKNNKQSVHFEGLRILDDDGNLKLASHEQIPPDRPPD